MPKNEKKDEISPYSVISQQSYLMNVESYLMNVESTPIAAVIDASVAVSWAV